MTTGALESSAEEAGRSFACLARFHRLATGAEQLYH
jgi:hypothetical protein